jgi:hypothetical protein
MQFLFVFRFDTGFQRKVATDFPEVLKKLSQSGKCFPSQNPPWEAAPHPIFGFKYIP